MRQRERERVVRQRERDRGRVWLEMERGGEKNRECEKSLKEKKERLKERNKE